QGAAAPPLLPTGGPPTAVAESSGVPPLPSLMGFCGAPMSRKVTESIYRGIFFSNTASGADIISIKNKEENTFIQETFKNHWQGPDYISLGMFFDTDDNAFKWYDKSEMKFTNWIEEESNEELLNTCASMYTKSGGWKKISCEELHLTGTLCKTACKLSSFVSDKTALTTTLVIIFTIVVTVSAALFWFLYKRNISSVSGALCITHHSTAEMPYGDETVLIDEENEYTV
uniref:C-type lectin domain-containing protein n=1 Tax=Chelydra serpentina TaxID=8475 RepID=A0A8C3SNP2_CHESE